MRFDQRRKLRAINRFALIIRHEHDLAVGRQLANQRRDKDFGSTKGLD